MKTQSPNSYFDSYIRSYSNKAVILSKKINVPMFNKFYGPENLVGFFEEGKYFVSKNYVDINNNSDLIIPPVEGISYYFSDGDYEIPETWNKECTFRESRFEESKVKLTFKNVYSCSSDMINGFMHIFCVDLILYPSKFLYLNMPQDVNNLDIMINDDIILDKDYGYIGENVNCSFKGSGTVKFLQSDFRESIEKMCSKEENIVFEDFTGKLPDCYACVGQSNLETCKAKINDVDSIEDVIWIWLAKANSNLNRQNIKRIYITDNQTCNIHGPEIFLTENVELTKEDDMHITINKNMGITALDSSAKLNLICVGSYTSTEISTIRIKYISAPTDINLCIYFYNEAFNLYLSAPKNYSKKSISIQGNCQIYLRYYNLNLNFADVFNKPETISFLEDTNSEYRYICCSDDILNCFSLDNYFLHMKTFEEFIDFDDKDYNEVYIFQNISVTQYTEIRSSMNLLTLCEGSSLMIDAPNKSRIFIGYIDDLATVEVIYGNNRSHTFFISDENIESVIQIKNVIYLDCDIEYSGSSYIPKIELKTDEKNIEVYPSINFSSKIHQIDPEYKIKITDGVSITSPMPEYLESIFYPISVTFSGICVYINEEGKSLCGAKQSISFDEAKAENIKEKIIVLTSGIDASFSFPSTWADEYFFYIITPESVQLNLSDASTLTYYTNSVQINEKYSIIAGNININCPPQLTFNVELAKGVFIIQFMYFCFLNCAQNEQTNIHAGYLSINQVFAFKKCIYVGGYDEMHKLTLYLNREDDMNELDNIMSLDGDEKGIKYEFGGYNYICFASDINANEKCKQPNYYLVSDVSSLVKAVKSFPNLYITVSMNLVIPESTGESFLLNAFDENIEITIPPSPKSIQILDNNTIQFNYEDNTFIKTFNKMIIIVPLKDNLNVSVVEDTQSKITFVLYSNVFISTSAKITANFTINVEKNNFHLYAEDANEFGTIFGDSIEQYQKICAYATNSESICTSNKKNTIENVFKTPFDYNEVEIAISSGDLNIALPNVSMNVNVNIKTEKIASVIINSVSSLQLSNDLIIINDHWIFIENKNTVSVILDKQSSLSIVESLSADIVFYLSDTITVIDLKNCVNQGGKHIKIVKFGEKDNSLTILGTDEAYNNFCSLLISYDGISIHQINEQKYLCICKDDSCDKCKDGIKGSITISDSFVSDPGENVEIRIFMNIDVSSDLFNNEHNVMINSMNTLTITDVTNVYQNIENKLKLDKLTLPDGNNLIVKPKSSTLYITTAKQKAGPEFTIEFSNYLTLNVTNSNEDGIAPSKIKVKGRGELNLFDYPSDKIEAESTIKVIKGIYIICNSKVDGSFCSYITYNDYKVINIYDDFKKRFDKDAKILVILDTYTDIIDVNIEAFDYQQLVLIKQGSSLHLLDSNSKVRILSTSVLTNKADSSMNLEGSEGGVMLSNNESDYFIVAFDDKLTIKQEGDIDSTLKPIVIQPQNNKATIVIDDTVKLEKQKIKIETEKEKLDLTIFVGDKPANDENINEFIDISEDSKDKINVIVKEGNEDEDDKDKPLGGDGSLGTGAIIGIVVGVVAFVAIVIAVVIIIIKKQKNDHHSSTEVSDQD